MTIKEKAKRYDEALNKARDLYLPSDSALLEEIFPELIENYDEKIREEIINYFKCQSRDEPTRKDIHNKWIAWLEKQGQTFTKKDVDDAYLAGVHDTKKELEKQGKSALEAIKEENVNDGNKVEPKFKVGDWVIDKQGIVHQISNVIENVTNHTYVYEIVGGGYFGDNIEGVRLWTIADAKDGDVLVDAYGNIGIYKSHDDFTWKSYCSLGCNRGFKGFEVEHENNKTHPATKEQRDALMEEWLPQDILLILKSKYKM